MKLFFFALTGLLMAFSSYAQIGFNSPAGVKPTQDFEVYTRNGFLVQSKYTYPTADPNATVRTMFCSGSASLPSLTQLAGIVKDPSGDNAYQSGFSYSCTQAIDPFLLEPGTDFGNQVIGTEIVFEDLDTEFFQDKVVLVDVFGREQTFSGSTAPARIVIEGSYVLIKFITDNDNRVGRGFRLRWRSLLRESITSPTPIAFGHSMQFDAFSGSFRTGFANLAGGFFATAIGDYNSATGHSAIAIGSLNTASGLNSTAMGRKMNTNGQQGAFMIGDYDPLNQGVTYSGAPNQFVARFLNGYYLMTSGDLNPGAGYGSVQTGVRIGQGQNSWATISDSTKKERFQPIAHADMLRKIGAMKLGTWNYKGQHNIRHYGPMAQDFYAAFGHDGLGQIGCDTLIYSHDLAGVTFSAVQALIRENEQLKTQNSGLKARLEQTERETADQRNRLEALERRVLVRPRPLVWAN